MGKYFGTDGFRGEANVKLTVEHAYKVGRYLGWYYKKEGYRPQIVIGKDTRRSSYMFEYSLVAGLTASGADVSLLHVTTTPSVSYVVRTEGFDCGIMISASHNPFYDNGIMVGYYSLLLQDDKQCELNNLCVLPCCRHRGIGEKLLLHAFDMAKESGCHKLNIGIVEENAVLRKWYESFGFVHTGTQKFDFFPFTCGYMEKHL